MTKRISCDDAKQFGISCYHEDMLPEIDERRFRLRKDDGTAYIRTEAGAQGSWQFSHYHTKVKETYIVQSGWMVLAFADDRGTPCFQLYREDDVFTTPVGVVHNVYLPASAVIHTVKHGASGVDDRTKDEATVAFDEKVRSLSEAEMLERARSND